VQKDEFSKQIMEMLDALDRVARSQLARTADQEDAVLECIKRAWEKRGQLREQRFFRTWITRILINVCHDMQRANRKLELPGDIDLPVAEQTEPTDVQEALFALDEQTRLIIVLFHIEGYSTGEIANLLRVRPGTISSRLSRGRKQMQELLEKNGSASRDE
jgi:RNA polymerase sigma-70 factor (ECF subfamily)